jgi:hypothetical protein
MSFYLSRYWLFALALGCDLLATNAHGGGASLLSSLPFEAGITHVAGNYAFTKENYLVEGARRIADLGSPAIFIYMTNKYATQYPDKGDGLFGSPKSLTELAASPAYKQVYDMPFKLFLITIFTFSNGDGIFLRQKPAAAVAAEEQAEVHDLVSYLYATYKGTHKVFILKNWESDWFGMRGTYDATKPILADNLRDMINWLSARQAGVTQARNEAGDPSDVAVFNALEVNRPLDWIERGLARVLNGVVPYVGADMLTYSAYDATLQAPKEIMVAELISALNGEDQYAPDPLGLGRRRILISEYGLYENELPADTDLWRAQATLDAAKKWGASGAFLWELYDNECALSDKTTRAGVAINAGEPGYPTNALCRGNWWIRPDGTESAVANTIRGYWTAR